MQARGAAPSSCSASRETPGTSPSGGGDFLNYFYVVADTAADPSLRRWARAEGAGLAGTWRALNPSVGPEADPEIVYDLAYGSL